MKKLILTFAFLVQVVFAMADDKEVILAQPRHENVKMFLQAGTSTPVMHVLSSTDRIEFVRRHNKQWDLILVDGKAGYVLHSEIGKLVKEKAFNNYAQK